ncbi:MAG TPA: Ig-like domain-containing protein, partial [Candidatus Limnocylindrales bacterium]
MARSSYGRTADGGIDTSAPQTFTITVRPANVPPVVQQDGPKAATQYSDPIIPVTISATDVDSRTLSASIDGWRKPDGTLGSGTALGDLALTSNESASLWSWTL